MCRVTHLHAECKQSACVQAACMLRVHARIPEIAATDWSWWLAGAFRALFGDCVAALQRLMSGTRTRRSGERRGRAPWEGGAEQDA